MASMALRYGLALVFVAAALVLSLQATRHLGPLQGISGGRPPLFFLFAAVVASTWFGGAGPGWLSVIVAALVTAYLFLSPSGSLRIDLTELPLFAGFVIVTMLVAALTSRQRRAKRALMQSRDQLEARVQERTAELQKAIETLRAEIEKRARAQDQLRRSEAFLAEGQRIGGTGTWSWNVTTGKVAWSQEHFRIFGLDPEKTAPSSSAFMERIHPEDRPWVEEMIERVNAERGEYRYECRIVLPDGSVRHIQSLGHPAANAGGELEYIGAVMDITERKRAELARVMRLTTIGELAASVVHEINQPLAVVINNGNACRRWLANAPPNLEEARAAVQSIVTDAKRAAGVIRSVRALTRNIRPEVTRRDINDAIREVLAPTRVELDRHQVSVRIELAPGLRPVRGDRIQLQQVILNLIRNGIEAMSAVTDRPRVLRIKSGDDGSGGALVAVEDSGTGLNPMLMRRIFEPFFTTRPDGMGMGLAICRKIIATHGGRLWASPGSPHGAVFQFTAPAAADCAPAAGAA